MNILRRKLVGLGMALVTVLLVVEYGFALELTGSNYIQGIKVSGDLRLRYEDKIFQDNSSAGKVQKPVFRLRLRLAADFTMPDNFFVHTRFASGTGEQTSTNQTFTNEATQKQFWIDRAYLEWEPNSAVKLFGGKMENPLWDIYSSDAWIDSDINPEGAGENFNYHLGNMKLFLNGLQSPIAQISGIPQNVYLFSEQIGLETNLPLDTRLKIGYSYHDWYNINRTTSAAVDTAASIQEGNRRYVANGALINPFYVNELTAELAGKIANRPLSLQGTFLKNTGAAKINGDKANNGFQTGAIFGKAQAAKSWELAYFYKYLETDCTIANWADSDFGEGGTNRKGHIMWISYAPKDWLTLKIKYFMTKQIKLNYGTTGVVDATKINGDINRVMVDAVVKF